MTKPKRHLIFSRPQGTFVATLDDSGITLRQFRKHKGVHLSYEDIAILGLSRLQHVRWPKDLLDKPLEQLTHLSRRPV